MPLTAPDSTSDSRNAVLFGNYAAATEQRKKSFAIGYALEIVALALFVRFATFAPKILEQTTYKSTELVAPAPEREIPKPPKLVAPKIAIKTPPPQVEPPKLEIPQQQAKIEPTPVMPKRAEPQPPQPQPKKVEEAHFDTPAPIANPNLPKQDVKTDVFSGSSAKPTIKADARKVQTGGFGDPNGVKGEAKNDAKLTIAKVGSFDMPAGGGSGNGSAGKAGIAGVVASAGFGSGVAGNGNGDHGGNGRAVVKDAGFGGSVAEKSPTVARAAASAPSRKPVEILSKPTPNYTDEARRMKIEGEVALRVNFLASGEIQVVQVVSGLGHGLDESAQSAARRIRFRPAQCDGQPCDSTATVRIVFQLAS